MLILPNSRPCHEAPSFASCLPKVPVLDYVLRGRLYIRSSAQLVTFTDICSIMCCRGIRAVRKAQPGNTVARRSTRTLAFDRRVAGQQYSNQKGQESSSKRWDLCSVAKRLRGGGRGGCGLKRDRPTCSLARVVIVVQLGRTVMCSRLLQQ